MDDREQPLADAQARSRGADTMRGSSLDELAGLAATLCGAPAALIILAGDAGPLIEAAAGVDPGLVGPEPAALAALLDGENVSGQDLGFGLTPPGSAGPQLCLLGRARLAPPEGAAVGVLCVMDHRARDLEGTQQAALRVLAQQAMVQLDLRRVLAERDRQLEEARARSAARPRLGPDAGHREEVAALRAELVDSEARFRNMADHAPVMMWVTDPSGYCTYLNRGWFEFTGQDEAEALGFGWLEATHPDDRAPAEQAFVRANAARTPFRVEYRLRRADGSYRWAIDAASPRFGPAGEYLGYVGSVIDIQDRREDEERIRTNEEKLRLATDAADIGLWDVDLDNDTLFWPPRVKAMFGVSEDVPVSLADFYAGLHPEDFAHAAAAFAAALDPATRAVYDVEYRTVGKEDGVIRWVAAKGRGMFDEAGVCRRAIGTAIDITARKTTEQALKDLNETLEQRVASEVAQRARAEEALRQAQKMEAVGQLTGGIAHDFNNMLTGVIGSLDLVQRYIADGRMDRVQRYIDAASTSAQRAAALTARLLAFGRRQSLDLRAVDVNALVRGMEDMLHRTLGEQIALEAALAADLWPGHTDAHQLESALLNLCINARDAMPNGGTLTIRTATTRLDEADASDGSDLAPGDYVVISVTDTGIGMAASTVGKVFEPFFTTKPVGQGTGLGLSMVYGFTRQSGGHVRIESELGQGTTIRLYIPRSLGEVDAAAEPGPPVPAGAGETVMVVEDDPSVRMIVLDVLGALGYEAIEAEDGRAAIPILQSDRKIDLLISDVGLPGLNGRQLAEIARQHRPGLRVLFVTGYAQNAAVRAGFLDHGMEMMTKPFAIDALATRIREMLEGRSAPGL